MFSVDRISWDRHSGEDVEHAVAMFLARDFPTAAENIKPSRGDGGIDILVRLDPGFAVYQVKSFGSADQRAKNLTSSQKRQVEESMEALRSDPRTQGLDVRQWHLVMPLDPTLEAKKWLRETAKSKGLPEPVWHGISACDAWAAKYPDIIDYYFEGSRETIKAKAQDLLKIFKPDPGQVATWDPVDTLDYVQGTAETLSRQDPHYKYGVSSTPIPEGVADIKEFISEHVQAVSQYPVPMMVAARVSGPWISVLQVHAKTSLSYALEPLEVKVSPRFGAESAHTGVWKEALVFGKPLDLPFGSVDVDLTAPGGLGGQQQGAAIRITPHAPTASSKIRARLVAPDGSKAAELLMTQVLATTGIAQDELGPVGAYSEFHDELGAIALAVTYSRAADEAKINIDERADMVGRAAIRVLPVAQFLANATEPNRLLVAPEYGPCNEAKAVPLPPMNSDQLERHRDILAVASSLAALQQFTSVELLMPSDEELQDSFRDIQIAGHLARGHKVHIVGMREIRGPSDAFTSDRDQVRSRFSFSIDICGTWIDLGEVDQFFTGRRCGDAQLAEDGLEECWQVEGKRITLQRVAEG